MIPSMSRPANPYDNASCESKQLGECCVERLSRQSLPVKSSTGSQVTANPTQPHHQEDFRKTV
jgi:transposase InsO family protein